MHRRLWYPFESVIGPVHDYPFVDSYEVPFRFPTLNHVLTDNSASPTTKDDGLGAGAIVAIIIGVLVLLGTHLATHAMCVHPASFFATKAHTHAFKHTGVHTCICMHKRAHTHPRACVQRPTGRIGSRQQVAENVWLVSLGCFGGAQWSCRVHLPIIQRGFKGKPLF